MVKRGQFFLVIYDKEILLNTRNNVERAIIGELAIFWDYL